MTTTLWIAAITAGVVVYGAVAGVVWHRLGGPSYSKHNPCRPDFEAAFWIVFLVPGVLALPARVTVRVIDRRAQRKRLPEARVVK